MSETESEAPFLGNIGLVITYRCTIACPHCIVEAGPHRREEMPLEKAMESIRQARAYRNGQIRGLALTGGEPFYNLENLRTLSSYGRQLGLSVSVVTNAFWAPTREAALSVLGSLPDIRFMSVSTDAYHQRAIPLSYVQNALYAARELGCLYNIAVCTDNEEDADFRRIMSDLDAMGESERVRLSITFPVGRALAAARHFDYSRSAEPTVAACSMASSPVLFPDGSVIGCIGPLLTLPPGHPMHLGNLNEEPLAILLERAETNPVLHAIRCWGPYKLVELLRASGYDSLLPGAYIRNCICDVCYRLLADTRIVAALGTLFENDSLRQTVAYARVYYLNESRMAELYNLGLETGAALIPARRANPA